MTFCDAAASNLDWQWSVYSDPAKQLWQSCPGYAVTTYAGCFARVNGHMVDQSAPGFTADFYVMSNLEIGQSHDVTAQQSYVNCRAKHTSLHSFMRLVVGAAPGHVSDFADAAANLNWQGGANPQSISAARRMWVQSLSLDTDVQNYYLVLAVEALCEGQLHNANALRQYRSCFRDDAHRLLSLMPPIPPESAVELPVE